MSWATIKDPGHLAAAEDVLQSSQRDETWERKNADMRRRYESAIGIVSASPEEALALFALISDEIRGEYSSSPEIGLSPGTGSTELARLRYLSLKNRSQLLEEKGDLADALEYALEAQSMEEVGASETNLLFRICSLSIKLGDPWTPKMLLSRSQDFRPKDLLPVAFLRLQADIERLERSTCTRQNIRSQRHD